MSNANKTTHGLDIWVSWTDNPGGSLRCRKTRRSSDWGYVDFQDLDDRMRELSAEELLKELLRQQGG